MAVQSRKCGLAQKISLCLNVNKLYGKTSLFPSLYYFLKGTFHSSLFSIHLQMGSTETEYSFSVILSSFVQGVHLCLRHSPGLCSWILWNRVKCIVQFMEQFLDLSWGFENEAKLYPCEPTCFKFCPSEFSQSYKIMLRWLQGTGDSDCHFKIKKNLENASVSLESAKSPGLFVGLQSDGQVKPVVYTKSGNVFFYPQVIKCTFTLKYFIVFLRDGYAHWYFHHFFFSANFCC